MCSAGCSSFVSILLTIFLERSSRAKFLMFLGGRYLRRMSVRPLRLRCGLGRLSSTQNAGNEMQMPWNEQKTQQARNARRGKRMMQKQTSRAVQPTTRQTNQCKCHDMNRKRQQSAHAKHVKHMMQKQTSQKQHNKINRLRQCEASNNRELFWTMLKNHPL